jgi:hypothetical protein
MEVVKSAKSARLIRAVGTLAREAVAGSERLADGLAAARRAMAVARERTTEWRDAVVRWVYVAAAANTFIWLWGGLGQLCLIGWGRRRISNQGPLTP